MEGEWSRSSSVHHDDTKSNTYVSYNKFRKRPKSIRHLKLEMILNTKSFKDILSES